jgi:hypothetical protein
MTDAYVPLSGPPTELSRLLTAALEEAADLSGRGWLTRGEVLDAVLPVAEAYAARTTRRARLRWRTQ